MPVFNDSSNMVPLLPEGDYIFCVTEFRSGISSGPKTRGSEKYTMEVQIEPSNKPVLETLTDHPSCSWKIDCFLKAAGVKLANGQSFDFREDNAADAGVLWVNPIGLRGWCHLKQETLPLKAGYDKPMTVNRVDVFYTEKPKLPRRAPVAEEDVPFTS